MSSKIPLFDLRRVLHPISEELHESFSRTMQHSNFILGPEVGCFEDNFSKKMHSDYCIGTSSGTDSLLAIFMALELPRGSEIIVPSFTFVASATSILRAGLTPVFVDLAKDSFAPDVDAIKSVWSENTRGVLFVHLFGEYSDLSELKNICDENNAVLIEDCAQSFGSKPGVQGIASAYSFFPAKNLGCLGDGGAILTNNLDFYEKLKIIRGHGSRKKYYYELLGGNFRLDTIQAGFLNVMLNHSDEWIERRKDNAKYYHSNLKSLPGVKVPDDKEFHSWNQYTLRTKYRNELINFLSLNGIGCAIYYPSPLHKSKIFNNESELPETDNRCDEVISIPIYPGLKECEREIIAEKIGEFFHDK